MAKITAAMVKQLRDKTGAGMMDAKKALEETGGDMEQAVDYLRTKGLAKAEKKSSRTAAEGLVGIATEMQKGAAVEINSETDFVARNEEFQNFVARVAEIALDVDTLEALKEADYGNGKTVRDTLTDLVAKIGENMTLRRMEQIAVEKGLVAEYTHGALAPGLGSIGVLVGLESEADPEAMEALGKQLAMHIAAANPQAIDRDGVDAAELEREREVLKEQAVASGKPPEIAEKMVEGRLRKFYEEICLMEQTFVIDNESKISDVLENAAKETGAEIKLTGFVRLHLGEGLEKKEEDFAAEVAKTATGS